MTWCWRMSPLVVVALVALRARWLAGLITRSAGRYTASAPSCTEPAARKRSTTAAMP
jgi:hypothetical protein